MRIRLGAKMTHTVIAAAAAVLIVAAATTASSTHLPGPPTIAQASPRDVVAKPRLEPAYTPSGGAILTGCTVSIANPAPAQGQTAETATIFTTAGAQVRLEAAYLRTRSVHGGPAGGQGAITFVLPIDHAPPGITVQVSAIASLRGRFRTCTTSFTPIAAPHALVVKKPVPAVSIDAPHTPNVGGTPVPTTDPLTTTTTVPPTTTTTVPLTTTTTVPPTTTTTEPPTTTTTVPPTTTTTAPPTTTTTAPPTTTTTVPPTTVPLTTVPLTTVPLTTTTTVPPTTVPPTTVPLTTTTTVPPTTAPPTT